MKSCLQTEIHTEGADGLRHYAALPGQLLKSQVLLVTNGTRNWRGGCDGEEVMERRWREVGDGSEEMEGRRLGGGEEGELGRASCRERV